MRGASLAVPLLLLAAAFLLPRGPARAQEREPAGQHLGAGSCAAQACHGGLAGAKEIWRRAYKTWIDEDRHAQAYAVLTEERGRRIGDRLGIEAHQAPACIACHATRKELRNPNFDVDDGVSCELCHGAATEWLGRHTAPGWKKLQPSERAARGFVDLSSPAARAEACVGCHVGGPGREVTHAMMAAGHPPLGFDGGFFDRMPPHWEDEDGDAMRVATWAASARADAKAQLARASRQSGTAWPDFATFDCYSCHHAPYGSGTPYGDAAKRGSGGSPGDLPLDLAGLAVLAHTAGADVPPELRVGWTPGTPPGPFGDRARHAVVLADRFLANLPDRATLRRNLDVWLAAVERGDATATRTTLERARGAVHALSALPPRGPGAQRAALDVVDTALGEDQPYAPEAWATLLRQALAAGE